MYLIVFKLYLVGLETVKRALSDWSIKKRHLSNLKFFACRLVEKNGRKRFMFLYFFRPLLIDLLISIRVRVLIYFYGITGPSPH